MRMSGFATKEKAENVMETAVIGITGMTPYAAAIKKSLKKVRGVSSVVLALSSETAYVDFDPMQATEDDLKKAIEKTGYVTIKRCLL